jgi:hypothetical protein
MCTLEQCEHRLRFFCSPCILFAYPCVSPALMPFLQLRALFWPNLVHGRLSLAVELAGIERLVSAFFGAAFVGPKTDAGAPAGVRQIFKYTREICEPMAYIWWQSQACGNNES